MKDDVVADLLMRLNIKFRYIDESVPILLADIDWQLSLSNFTRRDRPIDREVSEHYKRLLVAGRPFKAIVLGELPESSPRKYECHGGMHRLDACLRAGFSDWKHGAYIVAQTDLVRIDLMVGLLNTIEGKAATKSQQIELAAEFIARHSDWTAEIVAGLHGVSKSAVNNKVQQNKILHHIDELGGDLGYQPPQAVILPLGRIRNDSVLMLAVGYLRDHHPTEDRVKTMVDGIVACRSEEAQREVVQRTHRDANDERRRAASTVGGPVHTDAIVFFKNANRLLTHARRTGLERLKEQLASLPDWETKLLTIEGVLDFSQAVRDELKRLIEAARRFQGQGEAAE